MQPTSTKLMLYSVVALSLGIIEMTFTYYLIKSPTNGFNAATIFLLVFSLLQIGLALAGFAVAVKKSANKD